MAGSQPSDPPLERPEPVQVLPVDDIAFGGGLASGEEVFFDAQIADGSAVRLILRHTHVSAFIAKLMAFAGEAKKQRDEQKSEDFEELLEVTQMLGVQSIQVSPLADLSGVAIQFQIQPGVNMVFPLSTRHMPQLAGALTKWHLRLREAPPADPN